jgi:hypothetical protein
MGVHEYGQNIKIIDMGDPSPYFDLFKLGLGRIFHVIWPIAIANIQFVD